MKRKLLSLALLALSIGLLGQAQAQQDEMDGALKPRKMEFTYGVFIPAVEKGIRQALDGGAIAGFPVQDVEVNARLREYVVRLLEATRDPARYQLPELASFIEYGASPRAGVFLARAAQAYAFIQGRGYVTPDDVKTLAPDVLRHRLVTTYEAEAQAISAEQIVARLLEGVGIP